MMTCLAIIFCHTMRLVKFLRLIYIFYIHASKLNCINNGCQSFKCLAKYLWSEYLFCVHVDPHSMFNIVYIRKENSNMLWFPDFVLCLHLCLLVDMLVQHEYMAWFGLGFTLILACLFSSRCNVSWHNCSSVLQEVTLVHLQLRRRSRWMPALSMLEM